MRVLIVEDEIKIRKGMANLIEQHTNHTIVGEAENGIEGIKMAQQYVPDLIITDIRMPEMDGLEMIRQLRGIEENWHFVILSGYSEFSYAKQAIHYGVDDYLIKPLAPEDVISLLDQMEQKIKKEQRKQQGKPEKLLRDYLIENEKISEKQLLEICGFEAEETVHLICAYVGNISSEDRRMCEERFWGIKKDAADAKIYFFFTESTREFLAVLDESCWDKAKNQIEEKLLRRREKERQWVWLAETLENLCEVKQKYEELRQEYGYGLVFPGDKMLSRDMIHAFEPEEIPSALKGTEKELQNAFYKKDRNVFSDEIEKYLSGMRKKKEKPVQIKEEYMQMAHFLVRLAKENNSKIYEQLQNLNVIANLGTAVTCKEMENVFGEIGREFQENMTEQHNISNYVIIRAIDYIRNHYQESVSLENIAGNLGITPEYLSTLFNREMGENFSSFLKKFRISHAKRLLKGTDKKIYEIAAEVGYTDPKYFNRVFKEVEGVSPGEFRGL